MAVGSSSVLAVTSSNYFVSSNTQKTILQLSAISGMSAISLYYQEQIEETAKEILKTFFEITCAYTGMLLFKTDEPFKDYFYKIVPATAASKATEYYLDSAESSAITSFALPFLISSLVYNQASIQESYKQLKRSTINILNGELEKQLLKPVAALVTDYTFHSLSSKFSQITWEKVLNKAIFSSAISISQPHSLLENILSISSSDVSILIPPAASCTHPLLGHVSNVALNSLKLASVASRMHPSKIIKTLAKHIYPLSEEMFTPILLPIINQLLAQLIEQQLLQILNSSKEYLTILQQDDIQELLLKIQNKLNKLDPAVEELKNQFLREVFLKKTGTPLTLDNPALDLLKKSSEIDIQANLFTSFKKAPPAIRMLWNSYSYHKKVDQTLTLELLLQGLVISGLADLMLGESHPELTSSFSYPKMAGLVINLAL